MKFLVNIVLFIFITFLSTPTLIGMFDDKVDTSDYYTMCEEEIENFELFNEIKSLPSNQITFLELEIEENTNSFISTQHDFTVFNLAHQIFSPPPNRI